ncbi:NAD(P)-dependent oxidoreductase [Sphingomonas sp.]|uniref:NAD-dependent epimerase/dehydratase family protein n=1 Tax=Sphingomonas sp. TaxID=28214 RepID=UPI001EC7F8DB|nr:NAD(P)-dependent oxidoreductase [Sphingomonas sp.]MBX3593341.1 NAD(P)-dependent oxidoreductase [Sphingomonas sp.]
MTGAAGFIGRHLVRHLADAGVCVSGLDLVGAAPAGLADTVQGWQTGPLSPAALAALAAETGIPGTIYHLAGGSSVGASLADPHGDLTATVAACGVVLDWLRTHAPETRLVVVSSAAVYGNLHAGPIADTAATSPFSPYGAHKFAMETVCRGWAGSFGMPIAAARLFSVYGPGLTKQLLWDLSGKLAADTPTVMLGGTGEELRDWTHVDDVVRALAVIAPLASPDMPVINAGSGTPVSVRRIAATLADAFDRDENCLRFSGESRPGDPFSLVAAPGRLQATGFEWQVGLEDGIGGYARWYRSRGGR